MDLQRLPIVYIRLRGGGIHMPPHYASCAPRLLCSIVEPRLCHSVSYFSIATAKSGPSTHASPIRPGVSAPLSSPGLPSWNRPSSARLRACPRVGRTAAKTSCEASWNPPTAPLSKPAAFGRYAEEHRRPTSEPTSRRVAFRALAPAILAARRALPAHRSPRREPARAHNSARRLPRIAHVRVARLAAEDTRP